MCSDAGATAGECKMCKAKAGRQQCARVKRNSCNLFGFGDLLTITDEVQLHVVFHQVLTKKSGCLQMGFLDWSQGPLQQSSDLRFRSPHLSNSFSFGNFSSVRGTERTRMMWWRRWVRRWRRRSKTWWSHEDVKMSHGWLIGTLIMVYSNPYITG